jgi:trigger factor
MPKVLSTQFESNLKFTLDYLVEKETYEPWKNRIIDQVLQNVEVPGFRKGKAPAHKLMEHVNQTVLNQNILRETIEKYGSEALDKAKELLDEQKRTYIAFEINLDPEKTKEVEGAFQFQVVARLLPEVDLNSLDKIEVKEFTEKDLADRPDFEDFVKTEENKLLTQNNLFEESNGQAAEGDQVLVDMQGELDGKEEPKLNYKDMNVALGVGRLLPDFEKGLNGVKKEEEKSFEVNFPDDYFEPSLAGKTPIFKVKCKSIKKPKFKNIDELIKNQPQLAEKFQDAKGFSDFLKQFFDSETNRRLEDLKQKYVLQEVVKVVPDFDLQEESIEQEVNRITNFLKEESTKRGVSIGEFFSSSGIPGSDSPKVKSMDELQIKQLVEQYVRNEFKLSNILSYIYETQVEEKPSSEQIENTYKEVVKNPKNYGFDEKMSEEELRRAVTDRIIKQSAAKWLFFKVMEKQSVGSEQKDEIAEKNKTTKKKISTKNSKAKKK